MKNIELSKTILREFDKTNHLRYYKKRNSEIFSKAEENFISTLNEQQKYSYKTIQTMRDIDLIATKIFLIDYVIEFLSKIKKS